MLRLTLLKGKQSSPADILIYIKQIADQLGLKYGKKFAHEASINANSTVNERVCTC